MDIAQIQEGIIKCLRDNIELSGEPTPELTKNTAPLRDIGGFDSLRALEVLMDLSQIFDCELTHENVFDDPDPSSMDICMLAEAIQKIVNEMKK